LAVKKAEIATIEKMLKVLHGLKWSGAVYNAISRISADGVDENPESGYDLKYEMDVLDGLYKMNYLKADRNIPKFDRVAVKLSLGTSWVWVSFDAFSQVVKEYVLPSTSDREVVQKYVKNMRVFKSASAGVKVNIGSTIAQGNIEIWVDEAKTDNFLKVPQASDGLFDFGDEQVSSKANRGCFQIHDYLSQQTVLAVNDFFRKDEQGVGIGNQPVLTGKLVQPDWSGAKNTGDYRKKNEKIILQWYFQSSEAAAELKNKATKARYGSQALNPTPPPVKTYPCDNTAISHGTTEHKQWCCKHQQKPTETICCVSKYIDQATCCKYPDSIFSKREKTKLKCA